MSRRASRQRPKRNPGADDRPLHAVVGESRGPPMADTTPSQFRPKLVKTPDDAAVPPERYRLSLIKGEHRWQFRWDPRRESQLIDRVARLPPQPAAPLDWDAVARICRHIAQPLTHAS